MSLSRGCRWCVLAVVPILGAASAGCGTSPSGATADDAGSGGHSTAGGAGGRSGPPSGSSSSGGSSGASGSAGSPPDGSTNTARDAAIEISPSDRPSDARTEGGSGGGNGGGGVVDGGGVDTGWAPAVAGGPAFSGPTVAGTVTVDRATPMGHLAPGFAGFSYEKSHLTDGFFTGGDAPLIALYRLLGPGGVVRIGANDVDVTSWVPGALPVAAGAISPNVGTSDVDGLAAFLSATGWKAIYAVNFKTSTPATAAAEASYVASKLGPNLAAFEIGNEPNFIGSWASVRPKWEAFAAAIRAAVPNASLAGPAAFSTESSSSTSYATSFAHDEASQAVLLTQHYYIAGASAGSTLANMLAPMPAVVSESQALTAAVTANHIRDGFRWGEMNSYAHHGAPGVSDALGSAFWGIDFMLTTAQYDCAGVNFHGGSTGMDGTVPFTYAPILETAGRVASASPLFFGMLLVSRLGVGNMLATKATAGALNFSAYTVAPSGGGTNVVLVNKDASHGIQASLNIGAPALTAIAVYLQGLSLGATTGQTFAGAGITPQGMWSPKPPYSLSTQGNVIQVLVPPASAVLVQAQ